ncbi:MAG: terminase small subunit [Gallionellaceae bacterium]|jgi:phage terminase Nu1 subunit (DNA packaging protein)
MLGEVSKLRIIGQEIIASVFGVAPKTIVEWQEQGFPVAVRGGPGVASEYETEACVAWMVDREVKKVQTERPQDRLARVQADKIEMENAEKRQQLIPAEQLEPKLKAAFVSARERLLEAASRLARELPADTREREEMLQVEFEAFLHRLADWAHADQDVEDDA